MASSIGGGLINPGTVVGFATATSGTVGSGSIVDGSITSGKVASGAVKGQAGGGFFVIASGTVSSFDIASGAIVSGRVASGQIGFGHLADASVRSGTIASGVVGFEHLGDAGVRSGTIASGVVGFEHLGNTSVRSGTLGSGAVTTYTRSVLDDTRLAGQAISGVIAVTFDLGGQFVVPAERASGLRLPAIGVNTTNATSGVVIQFVTRGFVPAPNSGTIASGTTGLFYVGSGGLIVNQSGYMDGASSGPGPGGLSGTMVQRIGLCISGGIYVNPDMNITSGLISGLLGKF